jgi:hypothetical protein
MGTRRESAKWLDRQAVLMMALVLLLALFTATVVAQTGGGYDLTWYTIDGGGATVSGGGYELAGTVGQADAGTVSGGGYVLASGFWSGGVYAVYLPLVIR